MTQDQPRLLHQFHSGYLLDEVRALQVTRRLMAPLLLNDRHKKARLYRVPFDLLQFARDP